MGLSKKFLALCSSALLGSHFLYMIEKALKSQMTQKTVISWVWRDPVMFLRAIEYILILMIIYSSS